MSDGLANSLEKRIEILPKAPGVYLLKNKKGNVIYVGKAKNLRNRVKSYLQRYSYSPAKTHSMVSQIADMEHIITNTEKEALILESTLIKRHRPRYNVILKDDKNYPYLKLTTEEQFPRLSLVRRVKKDKSLYFGPFASAQAVRETMKVIHQHFLLRKCQTKSFQFRHRPCINYQMGQCPAPCFKLIDGEKYSAMVKEVELFLKGRSQELITLLEEKMEEASDQLNFEVAAKIRDRITSLKKTLEKQKVIMLDFTDRDVISFYSRDSCMTIVVLFMRSGKIIGSKDFFLKKVEVPNEEIISSFVNQFYYEDKLIPREILLPVVLEDKDVIQDSLRDRRSRKVDLVTPQRGEKTKLIEMAKLNAESVFRTEQDKLKDVERIADELKGTLCLKTRPLKIECYDISNLGGRLAVGSMVYFKDGEPLKNNYRRFRIKTVEGANDCGMLYEVLQRRFGKGGKKVPSPDLIVVDGGKGQLNVALKVMQELNLKVINVVALAKGRGGKKKGFEEDQKIPEQIFLPWRKNPLILSSRSAALLFLERIRDESHRFALAYHKKLRYKKDFHSFLEDIPGVGEKIRNKLLKHFGNPGKVKKASISELCQVPHVKQKVAENIYSFFRTIFFFVVSLILFGCNLCPK
jgi:excinuclease ABC subunit C